MITCSKLFLLMIMQVFCSFISLIMAFVVHEQVGLLSLPQPANRTLRNPYGLVEEQYYIKTALDPE